MKDIPKTKPPEAFYICLECAKDIYLKNYIERNSTNNNLCTICLKKKPSVYVSNNTLIINFCRFLIRYHYPEYEYNGHWGGEDLPHLFYFDNPIISHLFADRDEKDEKVEEFLYVLFDLDTLDNKIELYFGHTSVGRGLFPNAIKDEKSKTWIAYKRELQIKNFFLLEDDAKEKFSKLLNDLRYTLKKSEGFFRARIGYKEKTQEIGISEVTIKIPFSGQDISSPSVMKSRAGRANRAGVAFLYLASDKVTAVSEVRPHPGHYVSIGQFINNKELLLADLRFIDLIKYFKSEKKLQMFKILKDLSDELSIPILPEEQENYLVSQFISDVIRQLGFDGILFKSSVSNGYNLVGFNSSNFNFVEENSELIKITTVNFHSKKTEYRIDRFLERAIEI